MENTKECPLRASLRSLGGKWNMIILKSVGLEEIRFGAIKKSIPDISEKVLIEKLKQLVENGLVERKDYQEVPPKVSYRLTTLGKEALPIIKQMESFGTGVLLK